MAAFELQWWTRVVATETLRPTKPETFTLWPFTKKCADLCLRGKEQVRSKEAASKTDAQTPTNEYQTKVAEKLEWIRVVWNRPLWVKPGLTRTFIQPLIYMGMSQPAVMVSYLPGKKHVTSLVFVFPNVTPGGGFLNLLVEVLQSRLFCNLTHTSIRAVLWSLWTGRKTLSHRPPSFSNRSQGKTTTETCLYNSGFLSDIRQTSDN